MMIKLYNKDFFAEDIPYTFDLAIVDPPYGVGYVDKAGNSGYVDKGADFVRLAEKLYNLMNDNSWVLVFTSFMRYCDVRRAFEQYFSYRQDIIWYRPNLARGTKHASTIFTNVHETVMVFSKGKPGRPNKVEGRNNTDILKYATPQSNFKKDKRIHPNQKAFGLIEHLVLAFSNEGDWVIDPFAGSGVTGKVCKLHNRNFVGYEINEIFYKKAVENIGIEIEQC